MSLGHYRKAIEYVEKQLKIAIEIGDREGEGRGFGSLGDAYQSLGDYRKAIEYHERQLKIAIKIGDRGGEGKGYGSLGDAYESLGDYRKAIEYHEKSLKIAREIGDQAGEGTAYHSIGIQFLCLEEFENAVHNFVSAVDVFNALRSLLKSEDNWKIHFRGVYEATYTALWMSLLTIKKIDEALFAAEQGRAQTLSDNLLLQYKLDPSLSSATIDTKETISRLFTKLFSPTLFLAIDDFRTNIWFLRKGEKIIFREGTLEGDRREKDPLLALLKSSLQRIGAEDTKRCEDRTFDELDNECSFRIEKRGEGVGKPPSPPLDNPFQPFYDAVIDPIFDMLEPQDDELVIVSDGFVLLNH
ncbi:PREDICTED: tetratricopeptide repeat protein 28-like [Acropora digitifera]|uniref:tetratricopeptide repeat protein 28-like n=1 Tax=Acropora digitifera TaxID=70779 RepID=UPI00077AB041|nr:PREDICTED: tetratricopeptide repeat protein 28-like [Acropora digitifera]